MYLSIELQPVKTPKPANRLAYVLKIVGGSAVVLVLMGCVIIPFMHFVAVSPNDEGWSQLLQMYGILAGLISFVPMLFIAQELRWKRRRQAAEEHCGPSKAEAQGQWWRVLGARLQGDRWLIDCGHGRLLRRIEVPESDLVFTPLDRLELQFGKAELDLPRYDSQPVRLDLGGPVTIGCLPDELPPLREDYLSSLP